MACTYSDYPACIEFSAQVCNCLLFSVLVPTTRFNHTNNGFALLRYKTPSSSPHEHLPYYRRQRLQCRNQLVLLLQLRATTLTRSFNQRRSSRRSDRSVSFSLPSSHKHSSSQLRDASSAHTRKGSFGDDEKVSDISLQTYSSYTNHTPTPSLGDFRFPPQPDGGAVLPTMTAQPAARLESDAGEVSATAKLWRPQRHSNTYTHAGRGSSSVASTTSTDAGTSVGGSGRLQPSAFIESHTPGQKRQVLARHPSISSNTTLSSGIRRLHYEPAVFYPQQNYQLVYPANPAVPVYSGAFGTVPALQQLSAVQGQSFSNVTNTVQVPNFEPLPLIAPPPTPVLVDAISHAPWRTNQSITQAPVMYEPAVPVLNLSAPSNFIGNPAGMARADTIAARKFQEDGLKSSLESIPELCTQLRHRQTRVNMARSKLAELEATSNTSLAPPLDERYAREYKRFLDETNGVFEAVAKGKENYPAKALAALGVSLAVVKEEHDARLRTTQIWQEIQTWKEALYQSELRAYEARLVLEQARHRLSSLERGDARKMRALVAGTVDW